MKLVKEGAGTMLDNTGVLWGNELGKGYAHSRDKVPYVMAGSAGGYFKTGRYLKYNNDSHSNLLVSKANAMSGPITSPSFSRWNLSITPANKKYNSVTRRLPS